MRSAFAIVMLCILSACAGALLQSGTGAEARFQHRELGYSIAYPSVLSEPGWEIERLENADLLVRHPEGSLWSLASTCRATSAGVETLAGELARAAGGSAIGRATPIEHAGLEGLSQRLEGTEDGRSLEIKTVTLRGARCTYDWILIAPSEARREALEPAFDAWWQSFEPGPGEFRNAGASSISEGSLPSAEGAGP